MAPGFVSMHFHPFPWALLAVGDGGNEQDQEQSDSHTTEINPCVGGFMTFARCAAANFRCRLNFSISSECRTWMARAAHLGLINCRRANFIRANLEPIKTPSRASRRVRSMALARVTWARSSLIASVMRWKPSRMGA